MSFSYTLVITTLTNKLPRVKHHAHKLASIPLPAENGFGTCISVGVASSVLEVALPDKSVSFEAPLGKGEGTVVGEPEGIVVGETEGTVEAFVVAINRGKENRL